MTDAEIIKNLECCTNDDEPNCKECTKRPHIYCMCELLEEALDLIKRQEERMGRIVEQLEGLPNVNSDYWNFADLIDREDAIEIVKGGGVDEC